MDFFEFFMQEEVRLPIEQEPHDSIRKTLEHRFGLYHRLTSKIFGHSKGPAAPGAEIIRAKNLSTAILQSLNHYLSGHPFDAYETLLKALDAYIIFSLLESKSYNLGQVFYRLRMEKSNFSLKKIQLFHIPFDNRHKVASQRYSIPGFPCLYIADSIYVAWEELRRPSLTDVQGIRLVSKSKIQYLDLANDAYILDENIIRNKSEQELWDHFVAWPLVAACSVKVKYKDDPFKPEYIIPQLLLQIVRKKQMVDGIRFSSTHVRRTKELKGSFYNLVLPVKSDCDAGLCFRIEEMFELSHPVPWEIATAFSKGKEPMMFPSSFPPLMAVEQIELSEGNPLLYRDSAFGMMQWHLAENMLPKK